MEKKIMEKRILYLFFALIAVFSFSSCDDDDDNDLKPDQVPAAAVQTMNTRFPDAQRVSWEYKGAYVVAEFYENGLEKDAWFTRDGVWKMTEVDYRRDLTFLPAEVNSAFETGEYGYWTVDDIKYYERTDKSFYLIEVEKAGQRDMDLYYATDGALMKAVVGSDVDITPDTII